MLFGSRKTELVTPQEALPGRDTPMPVPDRHAVLGTPLRGPWPAGHEVVYLALGCFWGGEELFWQVPGVYSTAVGYQGGYTPNPTYEETCTARTGHTEIVQVVFDPARVSLETLLKLYWEQHDPTTPNRQGNDIGTQYRSAIYPTTEAQLATVLASRDRYQQALKDAGKGEIMTEIRLADEAGPFYYAEDYHQQYLHKNPYGYRCHAKTGVPFPEDK